MASTRARSSTSLTWASSILILPSWRRCLLIAGRTFSASSRGMLTRTVSPLASELMTRTCSQRSLDTEVVDRSEEHTSELQSQSNLVCRLLLEKKNQAPILEFAGIDSIHC